MIRFGAWVLALVAMASGVSAQDVVVRSGEHPGYTRLVFTVPPDTGWVLTHRKNGARLAIALDDVRYQTSGVFRRLSTNRLDSLSQAHPGAALDMEFGCDCVASAFEFRNSMIVVDIGPGDVLPPLTLDIPLPRAQEPSEAATRADLPEEVAGLDLPLLALNGQSARDQLYSRLLQGADREVLGLNLAPTGPRASRPSQPAALPAGLSANVTLSTVLDDLEGLLSPDLLQLQRQPVCISTEALGFANWANDRPFSEQVAELRTGLFGEFDRIDEDKAIKLARLNAYFGFGIEAQASLDLLVSPPPEATRIAAIAAVVDDQASSTDNPFHGLQSCDSDAAMWAVLTEKTLASDANTQGIEQSFAELPDHLRRSLGPRLASIFTEASALEPARRILRSVDRINGGTQADVTQVKAQVAAAEGDDARAEALLTDVVGTPEAAIEAPVALARLVEKRWQDRGAVSPQELGLAASYALEFRRSEIGPLMTRTHVIALGLSNEFDTAFDLIESMPGSEETEATLNRHLHLLAERSDDLTFLSQTATMPQNITNILTTDTAIALSDRLIRLGFTAQAFALANRPQDKSRRTERGRIRARAAFLDNRPHQAILELSQDTSDEADALRVEALNAIKDYAAAGRVLKELGDVEAANRFFWLEGLAEEIDASTDDKYAALSAATQILTTPAARDLNRPLADAERLLQSSADTRHLITDLLASVQEQ